MIYQVCDLDKKILQKMYPFLQYFLAQRKGFEPFLRWVKAFKIKGFSNYCVKLTQKFIQKKLFLRVYLFEKVSKFLNEFCVHEMHPECLSNFLGCIFL